MFISRLRLLTGIIATDVQAGSGVDTGHTDLLDGPPWPGVNLATAGRMFSRSMGQADALPETVRPDLLPYELALALAGAAALLAA